MILRNLPLLFVLALTMLASSSCTVTRVNLDYNVRSASIKSGPPKFAAGAFNDLRDMKGPLMAKPAGTPWIVPGYDWGRYGPHYLGSIRSVTDGFQDIFLEQSASEVTQEMVGMALHARGMTGNRYTFEGEILELYCELANETRPYAVAKLRVSLTDSSGKVLHSDVYKANRQTLDFYRVQGDPVYFLRQLTGNALQDAIDHALDDPAMRKAAGVAGWSGEGEGGESRK